MAFKRPANAADTLIREMESNDNSVTEQLMGLNGLKANPSSDAKKDTEDKSDVKTVKPVTETKTSPQKENTPKVKKTSEVGEKSSKTKASSSSSQPAGQFYTEEQLQALLEERLRGETTPSETVLVGYRISKEVDDLVHLITNKYPKVKIGALVDRMLRQAFKTAYPEEYAEVIKK